MRRLRGDASEAGHTTQVGQQLRVIVADGDGHVAVPRASAVVRADLEAALGVQEPGQRMSISVGEPLSGAYPLLYERIATDRSAHESIVATAADAFQGSITYVLEHS